MYVCVRGEGKKYIGREKKRGERKGTATNK